MSNIQAMYSPNPLLHYPQTQWLPPSNPVLPDSPNIRPRYATTNKKLQELYQSSHAADSWPYRTIQTFHDCFPHKYLPPDSQSHAPREYGYFSWHQSYLHYGIRHQSRQWSFPVP